MAVLDLRGQRARLCVESADDLIFGHGFHDFALHRDDAFVLAGEDGNVGALGLAGAVNNTAHDCDLQWCADGCEFVFDLLDEGDEVDFEASACGGRQ